MPVDYPSHFGVLKVAASRIWGTVMAFKMHPSISGHVGDWLRTEIVEPSGRSVSFLGRHFGVSRQTLSALLNGRARLSPDMALRFEKGFGVSADTLMRMQAAYELAQVRTLEGNIQVARVVKGVSDDGTGRG